MGWRKSQNLHILVLGKIRITYSLLFTQKEDETRVDEGINSGSPRYSSSDTDKKKKKRMIFTLDT